MYISVLYLDLLLSLAFLKKVLHTTAYKCLANIKLHGKEKETER